jgi:hypothetical protein
MTKTLAEITSIIRFRGDMRNTVRFPDANIATEAQAAFAEGYELVVQQNEGFYDTTANVTTSANTAFVALPAGPPVCWIVRAIDRLEGTDYVPVPRIGVKDRNKYGSTTGKPVAHRLTARGIDLYPTPDAVYTLRVTYTPVAPTLDTTAREFYNSWEEYTVFGALVRLYDNQGRDSSVWQKQLAAQADRIRRGADQRDASGPEYLNLREGWSNEDADDVDRWRPGF